MALLSTEEKADDREGVTEDGTPATPAAQVAEKQKQKQRTYVGIALAGVGIVVAIVLARKNAANNAAAQQAAAQQATTPGLGAGTVAGANNDYSGMFQSEFGSLQQQNTALQQQLASQQAQQAASQNALLAALTKLTGELNTKGGTQPEQNAHLFNSANYPQFMPGLTSKFDVFGSIKNGKIVGGNVGNSGAPVYALMNTGFGPIWEQDFNPATLPAGTEVGTPGQFSQYVNLPSAPGVMAPNIFGPTASASGLGTGSGAPTQTSGTINPQRAQPSLLATG